MKYTIRCNKKRVVNIDQMASLSGSDEILLGRKKFQVSISEICDDGRIKSVTINNKIYPVAIEKRNDGFPQKILLNGIPYEVEIERVESTRYRPKSHKKTVSGEVKATLPGQIVAILATVGVRVKEGQTLVILESMKMENEINAPKSGSIKAIHVSPGDSVMKGRLLIEIQ